MHNDHHTASFPQRPSQPLGYAMEKAVASKKANTASPVTPSVEQRRTANATELERVRGIEEQLRVRKRDILRSDTEGNRLYAMTLPHTMRRWPKPQQKRTRSQARSRRRTTQLL